MHAELTGHAKKYLWPPNKNVTQTGTQLQEIQAALGKTFVWMIQILTRAKILPAQYNTTTD